jgi:predicted ATP-dependent serine protease
MVSHIITPTTDTGFVDLDQYAIPDSYYDRLDTGNPLVNRIFGEDDGLMRGSTATLIANAGVGKTIFAMSISSMLSTNGYNVGVISGEESLARLAYRSRKLNIKGLRASNSTNITDVRKSMKELDFLVIDSFQYLTTDQKLSPRNEVKYLADTLVKEAQEFNCTTLIICQMTSGGKIRGGTILPHAVDTTIEIGIDEEDRNSRIIRVDKNRCGVTGEHMATISSNGYTFMGAYEAPKSEKEEKTKVKTDPVEAIRRGHILSMEGDVTYGRVMAELQISYQTAYMLLRGLCKDNSLVKVGRGDVALFNRVS